MEHAIQERSLIGPGGVYRWSSFSYLDGGHHPSLKRSERQVAVETGWRPGMAERKSGPLVGTNRMGARGTVRATEAFMSGGWGTRELDDEQWEEWLTLPSTTELSADEVEVDGKLAVLHDGARFRRWATRILGEQGLRFSEWRVLRATDRAQRLKRDAVSQQHIAQCAAMDESGVAAVMARLRERHFVDIGPDAWGWSNRVIMTKAGREALRSVEGKLARGGPSRDGRSDHTARKRLRGSRPSRDPAV